MSELEKLKQELKECEDLWSRFSCDCLGFAIDSLRKQIQTLEQKGVKK